MRLKIKRYQLIPHWSEFERNGEKYRFWAFVLGLSFPGYHIGLNTLITSIIGSNSIDTLLAYLILFGSMFMAIIKTPRSQWKEYFQFPLFIIIACYIILSISSWLNPGNVFVLSRIKTTFIQTACWGILVANLIDRTTLYQKAFKLIGYIVFWFLVYEPFAPQSTLFIEVNNSWGTSGYLTWGYRMLIAVILLLYTAMNSKRFIDWFFAIFATVELIMIGNRGSIVAIAIFIMLYVVLCTETKRKLKYIAILLCLVVIVYSTLQPENLMHMESVLEQCGVHSRNLTKLLDSTMTDSGRDAGYDIALNCIKEGNWFGLGIGGDQVLVGNYPHNILLEFMLQYGNIFGSVLFLILAWNSISIIWKIKNKQYKAIFVVFFSLSMVKLWLSSTYWYELWFWGYLIIIIKTRKYSTYYNEECICDTE
ncbi:O-antigen ligase family protein [Mediterraneibacter faecis]|uniref:O-antigen ligase family protein n=1 Tax=Mediterraneibacter faecis TaxID=592978 RepID=UPI003F8C56DA